MATINDETTNYFISTGGSDVKGEWIETIGTPTYDEIIQDGTLAITCSVKGKAREIMSENINFVAKTLRNGTELKFEDYKYKSGDDLYLYFKSPIDSYLAIFLVDDVSGIVYCALPYRKTEGTLKRITADKEYILFSQNHSDKEERIYVDEYEMTTEEDFEINDLYILFSPEPFNKVTLNSGELATLPKTTDNDTFHKWIAKERVNNPKLNLQKIVISIEKN